MPTTATATRPTKTAKATTSGNPEVKEATVQDLLDRYGFTYELVQLDIVSIDRKTSERNQARIAKPINEERVLLYAEAMTRGEKFPPIVVYKRGASYIAMDGNHRIASADMADIASLTAYVVDAPSPAEITTFTYEANTRHGLPTSLQDRIAQAIHLIEDGGSTIVNAAQQLGLPEQQLRNAVDIHEADKRFSGLGIKKFDRLSQTAKRRLDTIPNDVVLKAAADLAIDSAISSDELTKMVREVQKIKSSEAAQLAIVAEWRKARQGSIKATAGGRVKVAQPLVSFQRITSTINRTNIDTLGKHFGSVTPEARAEYIKATAASVEKLMDIIKQLRKVEAEAAA